MTEHANQLARDAALIGRRSALGLISIGGVALASCGSGATARAAAACIASPRETRGPFAGDGGSDAGGRRNVLDSEGIVRSDIRNSFAGMRGSADGVPLDLELLVVGTAGGCNPMADWAIYLWQNDAAGDYSLYNLPEQNYLRGLQQTDAAGKVRFRTILPGCYGGRAPHLHYEVFSSAQAAISGEPAVLASQFSLPPEVCRDIYANDARYGGSLANLERWNNRSDFVFRDASPEEAELQRIAIGRSSGETLQGTARVAIAY